MLSRPKRGVEDFVLKGSNPKCPGLRLLGGKLREGRLKPSFDMGKPNSVVEDVEPWCIEPRSMRGSDFEPIPWFEAVGKEWQSCGSGQHIISEEMLSTSMKIVNRLDDVSGVNGRGVIGDDSRQTTINDLQNRSQLDSQVTFGGSLGSIGVWELCMGVKGVEEFYHWDCSLVVMLAPIDGSGSVAYHFDDA
ncbi:hypothetical protein U1Q18_028413 [Sarracenia purpurea var. burkii]